MVKPYLSVIIPAFNESQRLPLALIDIDRELAGAEYSYEIIVVDDGSSDSTGEIANRLSSVIPNIRVIRLQENKGKGYAMCEGQKIARGNWRLFVDADNSIKISEFEKMIPWLKDGYDIVIASRIKGARIKNFPRFRRIAELIINFFARLLLRSRIRDFLIGFHVYSEKAANAVFKRIHLRGAEAQIEALFLAEKMGFRIMEIPAFATHEADSRFRFRSYFRFLWSVVKIKRWNGEHDEEA